MPNNEIYATKEIQEEMEYFLKFMYEGYNVETSSKKSNISIDEINSWLNYGKNNKTKKFRQFYQKVTYLTNRKFFTDKDFKNSFEEDFNISLNFILNEYNKFLKEVNHEISSLDEDYIENLVDISKKTKSNLDKLTQYFFDINKIGDISFVFIEYLKSLNLFKNELKDALSRMDELKLEVFNKKTSQYNKLVLYVQLLFDENLFMQTSFNTKVLKMKSDALELKNDGKNVLINNLETIEEELKVILDNFNLFQSELESTINLNFTTLDEVKEGINKINLIINKINQINLKELEQLISNQEALYNKLFDEDNFKEDVEVVISKIIECFNDRRFVKFKLRKYNLSQTELELVKNNLISEIANHEPFDVGTDYKNLIEIQCEKFNKNKLILSDDELEKALLNVNLDGINKDIIEFCKANVKNDYNKGIINKNEIKLTFNKYLNKKHVELKNLNELNQIKNDPNIPKIKIYLNNEETEEIYKIAEEKISSKYGINGNVYEFVFNLMNKKINKNQSDARNKFYLLKADLRLNSNQIIDFTSEIEFLISENQIKSKDMDIEVINKLFAEFKRTGKIIL